MAVADLPAFTRLLGVNVLHRPPERSEAELLVRAELCNRRGVLHGGAVMALGDTLGGITASISLPDGAEPRRSRARPISSPLCRREIPRMRSACRCIAAAPPSCWRHASPAATGSLPRS